MFANDTNRVRGAVLCLSQDGACTNLFENFGENNFTEKNANLRKILILLTNISKIIICFSELLFDASSNIDFFVTDWDFRCVNRYCFASERLYILKTKYFSREIFICIMTVFFCLGWKGWRIFGSAGGGGAFTETLGINEFFLLFSPC